MWTALSRPSRSGAAHVQRRADRRRLRRRRGSEIVEFAMIFPVYIFLFFGIMEFSWYFFQRSAVTEATRIGCSAAARYDPDDDVDNDGVPDFVIVARSVIEEELGRQAGIRCSESGWSCNVTIVDYSSPVNTPQRIACETVTNFRSLTGFLGGDNDSRGSGGEMAQKAWNANHGRLLPSTLTGRASSVFQEAQ